MKKDYNTIILMRKAMFRDLNKAIIVPFFKGVCNAVTVAMATIQRFYKIPFETQFLQNNLKTDPVT